MVAVKGLSTLKSRVSGQHDTRKSGGVKNLKVYTEDEKVKVHIMDHVSAETKRKTIPVKPETNCINANRQKEEALNKLKKNLGKNINFTQSKVGRKVLADISNSRSKDLKVFNGNPRTRLQVQENAGDVTRKPSRSYCPPQRKSLPVFKPVQKTDESEFKKGKLENKVMNKEKHGFPVKPKVGTTVVPQVNNTRDYLWKNRISDGYIKLASESQPIADGKRLSRLSMKPTVKTTVSIPRTQKASSSTSVLTKKESKSKSRSSIAKHSESVDSASESQPKGDAKRLSRVTIKQTVKTTVIPRAQKPSRTTSVFTKQSSATSVLTKKESKSKHSEPISCEPSAEASTSTVTVKAKSRRKSYTSLLIESTKLFKENVTKEETLPEIYDECNELEVAEYIDEIYRHYWVTEAHNHSLENYMNIQTEITPQMRGILINWLIEVHLKFDLMQETLYLMVTLMDYYLSVVNIKTNEMQLVGLTSLLLASKYEDFWHPKVMELISISAEIYTRDQMLEMETTILTKLNFRLNLPTPYVFMLRFLRAAQATKKFEKLAFFLIELCLVEYDALNFKPSLLCASAIYVARCTLHLTPTWTPLLCKHSHYQEFQIRDCADMILRFHKAARTAVLRVTYDKYTSSDNCKVAMIKPLGRLPPGNI